MPGLWYTTSLSYFDSFLGCKPPKMPGYRATGGCWKCRHYHARESSKSAQTCARGHGPPRPSRSCSCLKSEAPDVGSRALRVAMRMHRESQPIVGARRAQWRSEAAGLPSAETRASLNSTRRPRLRLSPGNETDRRVQTPRGRCRATSTLTDLRFRSRAHPSLLIRQKRLACVLGGTGARIKEL